MNKELTKSQLLFSVVIPTCHRNDLLALCLDRLAPGAQTLPADRYEVIITDDGSRSTAEALVREQYPWARWVKGPQKGPGANRNRGAQYAEAPWLVFTDDDCLPGPHWLAAFAAAVGPDAAVYEGQTTCEAGINSPLYIAPINLTCGPLWSCNMVVRRAVFEELRGFDEDFPFPSVEDIDLEDRLKAAGHPVSFVADAVVDHPPRRRSPGRQMGARLESQVRYWYKFGRGHYSRTQFPVHVKCQVGNIFRYRLSVDTLLALLALASELVYVLRRLRGWERTYQRQYGYAERPRREVNARAS